MRGTNGPVARAGIVETSCKYSPLLSKRMGAELFLKKDYRQMTGRCGAARTTRSLSS